MGTGKERSKGLNGLKILSSARLSVPTNLCTAADGEGCATAALSGYRKLWDHTGKWMREREQRYRTYYQGEPTTTASAVEHEHELHAEDGRYGHMQKVAYTHSNRWKIDQYLEDAGLTLDER